VQVEDSTVFDKNDCGFLGTQCNNDDYGALGVLEQGDCKIYDGNVWFGVKDQSNQYFILDFGCPRPFENIKLLNHYNKISNLLSLW
jgi:hypothetical protein